MECFEQPNMKVLSGAAQIHREYVLYMIRNLCTKLGLRHSTLYLAISVMDRFLVCKPKAFARFSSSFMAVASVSISAKFIELGGWGLPQMLRTLQLQHRLSQLCVLERKILRTIQYQLARHTAWDCILLRMTKWQQQHVSSPSSRQPTQGMLWEEADKVLFGMLTIASVTSQSTEDIAAEAFSVASARVAAKMLHRKPVPKDNPTHQQHLLLSIIKPQSKQPLQAEPRDRIVVQCGNI